jgi:hypothetical protein
VLLLCKCIELPALSVICFQQVFGTKNPEVFPGFPGGPKENVKTVVPQVTTAPFQIVIKELRRNKSRGW